METISTLLRRYIDLFEDAPPSRKIRVSVESYKNAETAVEALPTAFVFEFEDELGEDAVADSVRAQVRHATGYEPARFRWARA